LAFIEKELQQMKKDNVALAHYINAKQKEEALRKEEAQKRQRRRPVGR
jgi:predicted GIY-YIG superfamily endonuclease